MKAMSLKCLKCGACYDIPIWAMRFMTYREYSYCNKCHIEKEGKSRSLFSKIVTRRKIKC